MQNNVFRKWLSSILVTLLIFTSFPFTSLTVGATETTEFKEKEQQSTTSQEEENFVESGEAPPFPKTDPEEVVELRTETSKTIDNGDGTYTLQSFQEPIFRKKEGMLKEIQPKVKKQKAGKMFAGESIDELATDNTQLDIRFSSTMNENKYAVLSHIGHTLNYTFREASGENGVQKIKKTDATYEENKVFYKEPIPGLTLRNILFDDSVKEDVILNHFNGTNKYHFFIETDLVGKIEEDGSITFKNPKNETIFMLPKPFMTDSNINSESAEPQWSDSVYYELQKEGNGYAFTVVADENWLKDPSRVYPVYIDPTTKVQADQDAFVSDAFPNTNFNKSWDSGVGAYTLKVGNYDASTGEIFSYVKTPTPELPYAKIDTAIFNIYNVHSYLHTTPTGVWLDRVNGPWDASTINWTNKPNSSLFTSTSVNEGKWATFNVKNAINDWMKGTTPNYGFKLHTNGNGQTFWKKFYATEHNIADYRPHLNIAYSYSSPSNLSAKAYSLGDETGYIDLQWNAVEGASSYIVWIFDGNVYQPINVGNTTSWSTKNKSVWPKVGTNLPVDPRPVYRASGGDTYNDRTNYAISVSAVFQHGESPRANPIVPTIPNLVKPDGPKGVAYSNQIGTNSGYVNLEWDEIPGATGYKVWIFNGLNYEAFDVKNVTSWTTQNKGIWLKPEQIEAGTSSTLKLIQDGSGVELPMDPSPLYAKMGSKYETSKNYWFRISAYNNHGETVFSDGTLITKIPQGFAYLGMENYWTMIDVPNGKVNAATGNLLLSESDVSVSGNGPDLGIERTYNSISPIVGLFGKGWHSNAEMTIVPKGQDAKFTDEDGTIHLFKKQSDGTYKAPTGVYLELKEETDHYELKEKDQSIYYFSKNSGKLDKIVDGYKKETKYSFNADNIVITDVNGRKITLLLNPEGRVETIIDPLQRTITFKYNQDLLEKVTDSSGQVTQYVYDTNKDLEKIIEPTHTETKPVITQYEYLNNKLKKVTDAKNNVYSLDYDDLNNQLTLTKPNNKKEQYTFNEAGNPILHINDVGGENLTTSYKYVGNNLEESIAPKDQGTKVITESYKYENGNITEATDSYGTENYKYNGNNDVIEMEDTEDRKTTIAYDGLNPVSETDQSGKVSSISKYNEFGNIIESSELIGAANNLLVNNSFEDETASWSILRNNDTGSMTIDTNTANGLNGEKTLKLNVASSSPKNEHGYVAATQEFSVKPNTTYTLSGKVKTDLSKASAFFNVFFLDNLNKEISYADNRYSKLAGKRSWTDRQVTFTTPANASKIRIYLEVEHKDPNAFGEAWFDAVQLEKAEVSSSYNPIVNSSFEGEFTNWSGTGGTIVNDAFDGIKSLAITRNSSTQAPSVYKQTIKVGQLGTDNPFKITLTGLSKADKVVANGEVNKEDYSITATAHYTDGTSEVFSEDFPIGTQEWNRSAISIPATKPIKEIEVALTFKGAYTGTVWFDAIRLMKGSIITKNNYDKNGYLAGAEDELGYKTSSEYDDVGNKKVETDAKGYQRSYSYYPTNLLKDLLLSNGTNIHYDYDKNGNMASKSISDASSKSQKFQYEYDALNRLTKTTGPLNDVTINDYDDIGNKKTTILPNGNQIQSVNDGVDRVKSISYNNEEFFTFEYDKNGNEKFVTYVKDGRKKEKDYDPSDRVKTLKDRGGLQQWNYSVRSDKLNDFTFSHGAFTQSNKYAYNDLDQNTVVTAGGYKYRFDYDEKGNIQTFTTGNGTGATFSYDDRGLIKDLSIGTVDGSNILTEKYSYDANGNREKIEYDDKTFVSYQYDDFNQLLKETLIDGTVIDYVYDGFGNRDAIKITTTNGHSTTTSAVYNIANQLKQFGNEIIDYDDNGNRISDGKYKYVWNPADQLVSITKLGESTPFVTYQYDEDGRRIQKNADGTITNYHYDGDSLNVLYETDGQNNVVRSYTYSEGGQLLSMKKGAQTFFYHYNAHGDVIALTDQDSQKVASYEYDSWGNVLKADEYDQVKDNPYRYAGYQYDHETGMYYLIARYYQPEQGVFLSLDPDAGDDDDILTQNGYTYANNNPVNLIDPDGRFAFAATGLYLVPGAGQALLLATGVVVGAYGAWYLGKKVKSWTNKKSWDHIKEGHAPNSPARNKGKFKNNKTMKKTTRATSRSKPVTEGRYKRTVHEKSFKKNVGVNGNGKPTKRVKVIRGKDGRIVTSFPF